MIVIVSKSVSAINACFNIISNNRVDDYNIIKEIADKYKCIKFFSSNSTGLNTSFWIYFRTKNGKYKDFESEIIHSTVYDKNLKI